MCCFLPCLLNLSKYFCPHFAELRAAFSIFDKDGSGVASTKDVGRGMQRFFPEITRAEIQDMVMTLDRNGEFLVALTS